MRTCPYCGKEYSDDMVVCPNDQRVLLDKKFQWDDNNSDETNNSSRRFWIKIGAASLAYLPMIVYILTVVLVHSGVFSESGAKPIIMGCGIFNFPAFSILALIETFNVGWFVLASSAIILMFLWSSFLAWFFWKAAGTFQGEDEPEATRGKYDWVGFQVRFFIGFVVGFLVGWRFVKYTTSMKTLLIASFTTGIIGGLLYGLSRPPDFWSRG
jgi:hypothetical protein